MAVEDIGDVGVDVVTDFTGFEAQLRRMLNRMERQLDLEIPVDVDTVRASNRMKLWRKIQERFLEIRVKIGEKSLAMVSGQLASLTGLNSITNSVQNFNEHITGLFDNILPIAQKVGAIGAAAGPVVDMVGGLAIGLDKLGKAAVGGIVALPGIMAFAAASMFTFQSAFQDAGKVLGNSLSQFQQIQKTISGKFWNQAAKPVKELLNNIFPAVNKGFGKLGESAGGFLGTLAAHFKNALTPARIDGIFSNFSKGFDTLRDKATAPLARITTNLVEWGSTLIPKIADKLGGMFDKFDVWLQKGIDTGELTKAFDGFLQIIEDSWSILMSTADIIGAISKAAEAAGITAFPLAKIFDDMAKAMNQPAFQKGLTDFFAGAKRGAEGMKPAWEGFKNLLGALEPTISKFMGDAGQSVGKFAGVLFNALADPKFQANLSSMLTGFTKVFDNLTPAVQPFVDKLGDIAHFAGTLADVASKTLGVAIEQLAPIFGDLLAKLEPLIPIIGDFIQSMLKSDAFKTIGDALGTLIEGVTAFVQALDTPVLKFIINLIVDFIATAIAGFANLLGGVLLIVAGLAKLLSGDMSGLEDIGKGLMKGLEGAWQLFLTLFAPAKILKFLGPVGKMIGEVFKGPLKGVGEFFGKAFEGIGKFLSEAIGNIPGIIGTMFPKVIEFITKGAGDIGKFLIEGIVKGAQALIGGFLTMVWEPILQGIKDFFGIHSPSTVFMELGTFLIQGLINGIQGLINGVVDLFRPIVEAIVTLWNGMISGIIDLFNGFVAFLAAGWNLVLQGATMLWNLILVVVQVVWQGIMAAVQVFWDFIVTAFNIWLSIATSVWNAILAAGAAVWNAIQAIVAGVIAAIGDILNGLIATAQAIWSGILAAAQGAWDGIVAGAQGLVAGIGAVLGGIGDVVAGIFNGVKGTIEGIWNSIQLPNILGGLGIPGFADGVNNFGGGLAVVGERGPELVRLPKGSDVIPASTSKGLMSKAGTPVAAPAAADSKAFTFAPTIYNPKQETSEESLFKSAQNLAYLGLV